jgi:hypothetical protein
MSFVQLCDGPMVFRNLDLGSVEATTTKEVGSEFSTAVRPRHLLSSSHL